MRRKEKQTTSEVAAGIMTRTSNGILALTLEDGYPYAVPVSHLYLDGDIYFHTGNAGQKYDLLPGGPKVCFTAVEQDDFQPGKFTTYFRSAIAFGTASIVQDKAEITRLARALTKKYEPDISDAAIDKFVAAEEGQFAFVKITVEHLTGKEDHTP